MFFYVNLVFYYDHTNFGHKFAHLKKMNWLLW